MELHYLNTHREKEEIAVGLYCSSESLDTFEEINETTYSTDAELHHAIVAEYLYTYY